jgi:hypothetical protein
MNAVKPPSAKEAKIKAAKRSALSAALTGKSEGSSTSLAASYGLPLSEVRSAMRERGVHDNG